MLSLRITWKQAKIRKKHDIWAKKGNYCRKTMHFVGNGGKLWGSGGRFYSFKEISSIFVRCQWQQRRGSKKMKHCNTVYRLHFLWGESHPSLDSEMWTYFSPDNMYVLSPYKCQWSHFVIKSLLFNVHTTYLKSTAAEWNSGQIELRRSQVSWLRFTVVFTIQG